MGVFGSKVETCCGSRSDIPVTPRAGHIDDCPTERIVEEIPMRMRILYVEPRADVESLSTAPSSKASGGTTKAKTLSVVQAAGHAGLAILPQKLDKAKMKDFHEVLEEAGVDTRTGWGSHGAKSVEHLFWEAFVLRGCILTHSSPTAKESLKRVAHIVKVLIVADIFGIEHQLQSRLQFMHDGQCIERKQVLVKRLRWSENVVPENRPVPYQSCFANDTCPYVEPWRAGVKSALKDRLGLSVRLQEGHLEEELHSYSFRVEDNIGSAGYPGINTMYCIHEITLRVNNPEHHAVQCIGLPHGQEFATAEGDFNFSLQQDDEGLPLGTQLNIWTWIRRPLDGANSPNSKAKAKQETAVSPGAQEKEKEQILIKRVPIPLVSAANVAKIQGMRNSPNQTRLAPSPILAVAQGGRSTNWAKAKVCAERISDPSYSLKEFTNDLSAFPELDLYLLDGQSQTAEGSGSGRTLGDEFQRTMGAFYAIYWLLRLRSDGKDGFTFGVDEAWRPITHDSSNSRLFPAEKRLKFYKESSWTYLEQLLVDAEILVPKGDGVEVNHSRVLTILALTAIHDIMKVQALLPEVQPEHAPYHGYSGGQTISDHDQALSYVMDHFPALLPSFDGLDMDQKLSVAFTQCQLQFNQGWFVQAEAPPGAIFTKFRQLLIREHKSRIQERDIALYFVHWLTDLAGAEPTPLGGCEKFVIKFPLPVLNSFLRSFSFVKRIAQNTETEVMEEYLKMRWAEHKPELGVHPTGDSAIAKMRLICMAQMNSMKILSGFEELPMQDKEVLSTEMARTGCMGQSFSANLTPKEVQAELMGPALLIYYGPAFLQSLGSDSPVKRLSFLAEIYRSARELWPLSITQVATSVIVRIDTIKSLTMTEIVDNLKKGVWVLVKHNDVEAFVEHSSTKKLNKFISNGQALHVLDVTL